MVARNVLENIGLYRSLCRSQIPFVFCNRDVEGICAPIVKSNDYYGGYIATGHLLQRGYQHIAFIARQRYRTSIDRCQGYISALLQWNVPIDRQKILLMEDSPIPQTCQALLERMDAGMAGGRRVLLQRLPRAGAAAPVARAGNARAGGHRHRGLRQHRPVRRGHSAADFGGLQNL